MKRKIYFFKQTAWICIIFTIISVICVDPLAYASYDPIKSENYQNKPVPLSDEELASLTQRASMNTVIVSLRAGEGQRRDGFESFLIVLGFITLLLIIISAASSSSSSE
jgi:hypothetical protein